MASKRAQKSWGLQTGAVVTQTGPNLDKSIGSIHEVILECYLWWWQGTHFKLCNGVCGCTGRSLLRPATWVIGVNQTKDMKTGGDLEGGVIKGDGGKTNLMLHTWDCSRGGGGAHLARPQNIRIWDACNRCPVTGMRKELGDNLEMWSRLPRP